MKLMRSELTCRGCKHKQLIYYSKPSLVRVTVAKYTCFNCESSFLVKISKIPGEPRPAFDIEFVQKSERLKQILAIRKVTGAQP